jgi:hypothetical protein
MNPSGLSGGEDARADVRPDTPNLMADSDGDGIPDALDNCPTMPNPDQRDHDADGRGDVCDLCPHIAEAVDVDTDGDGVGDGCDPRPTQAGDRRALWVGFYDAADIAGWDMNPSSSFTVSLGRLTGGDVSSDRSDIKVPISFNRAFAQTSVRINTLANPTGNVTPGATLYTGDDGMSQFYQCEVDQPNNSDPQLQALDSDSAMQQRWPGTFVPSSELQLTDGIVTTTHTCAAMQGSTAVSLSRNASGSTGRVSIGSANANVSFDYLFVVEVGG